MIRRTRWRPNTCACVVDYAWSDTETEDERQHVDPIFEETCAKHQHIQSTTERFKAVVEENKAANPALQ